VECLSLICACVSLRGLASLFEPQKACDGDAGFSTRATSPSHGEDIDIRVQGPVVTYGFQTVYLLFTPIHLAAPPICLHFPHHMARTFYPLFHWCQWCLVHSRLLSISVYPLHHNTVLKPVPITPFNGHLTYPSDSHRASCVYDHTCSTWPSRHNDTELQWLD
jgi:hypothetical protein